MAECGPCGDKSGQLSGFLGRNEIFWQGYQKMGDFSKIILGGLVFDKKPEKLIAPTSPRGARSTVLQNRTTPPKN